MNKESIRDAAAQAMQQLQTIMRDQPDAEFDIPLAQDKWSMRQQAEHLITTVGATLKSSTYPKEKLLARFGAVSHDERDPEQLRQTYLAALGPDGVKVPEAFAPKGDTSVSKTDLLQQLDVMVTDLNTAMMDHWTEQELSSHQVPHPLLGAFTMREMLMFNAFHITHHRTYIEKYLAAREA